MFKAITIAAALAASVALAGCSQVVSDINAVTGALSSKQATQAAQNVQAFTTGFICGVGSLSGLASNIESALASQMKVGNAMVTMDTGIVYVVSTSVCLAVGGKVASSAAVSVPSTATTSTAALP